MGKKRLVALTYAKLEELTQAHSELIRDYILALNDVSKLKSLFVSVDFFGLDSYAVEPSNPEKSSKYAKVLAQFPLLIDRLFPVPILRIPTLSYLVRLFVESHVKGKLQELSIAYLYLSNTLPDDYPAVENYRTWLKDTSETCDKLSATLSSFQSVKGLASALWPILIYIAGQMLGVTTLREAVQNVDVSSFLSWIVLIVFPILYFCLFITGAIWYKYELFTGFTLFESYFQRHIENTSFDEQNVYQQEDRIFGLLNRGKVHEIPWDAVTFALVPIGFILLVVFDSSGNPINRSDWILIGLMFLMSLLILVVVPRLRKWK
jgi:hypothetical protein